MDYLELARTKLQTVRVAASAVSEDVSHSNTPCEISAKSEKRGSALEAAETEYVWLGEQIDALFDRARSARLRGDLAAGERLGAQVRALVVGPYLDARERYAALLNGGTVAQQGTTMPNSTPNSTPNSVTKTLVNPSARPIRLVLDDGTEHVVPARGMVRLEQQVDRVEAAAPLLRESENNAKQRASRSGAVTEP